MLRRSLLEPKQGISTFLPAWSAALGSLVSPHPFLRARRIMGSVLLRLRHPRIKLPRNSVHVTTRCSPPARPRRARTPPRTQADRFQLSHCRADDSLADCGLSICRILDLVDADLSLRRVSSRGMSRVTFHATDGRLPSGSKLVAVLIRHLHKSRLLSNTKSAPMMLYDSS